MEEELKSLPLENASILSEGALQDGHRLWIGNLDPKITEYHLLKLLQKFGKVKQFDFLFHKSGPLEGQPRGYCFVNFETKLEAEKAIQCLNGKMALSKKLVVRWAHAQIKRYDNYKSEKVLPISLEPSSSTEPTQSTISAERHCHLLLISINQLLVSEQDSARERREDVSLNEAVQSIDVVSGAVVRHEPCLALAEDVVLGEEGSFVLDPKVEALRPWIFQLLIQHSGAYTLERGAYNTMVAQDGSST
ncbi:unnamed protein product [Ranitomeya imitator]|uniref:Probable RNA-binding protein 18 n=1 Tax=Ranitomeya imitator TaxID=111125 RepID=A0ABN9LCB5_9NEOB|nr:unnamed protein product [Ranitomeya imitator]